MMKSSDMMKLLRKKQDVKLNDLHPEMRTSAMEILAELRQANPKNNWLMEQGVRSTKEQKKLVEANKSWVPVSKHQSGRAVDIRPYPGNKSVSYEENPAPYQSLGVLAKRKKLGWGGDWGKRDWGHIEMKEK